MKTVVSLSGGKDSTAMLLMMLERGERVDEIVFFDTGWEFPQMYDHLDRVERETGLTITRLKPDKPFEHYMLDYEKTRGKRKGSKGYGFPTPTARWCTRIKTETIRRHQRSLGEIQVCIGIAADEPKRVKEGNRYPLVEYGVTEDEALRYCYERGYDWGGLYEHFKRVSCFCCPLQPIPGLRNLRKHHPDLWDRLMLMDAEVNRRPKVQSRFRDDYDLPEIEMRFRREDRQMSLDFGDWKERL